MVLKEVSEKMFEEKVKEILNFYQKIKIKDEANLERVLKENDELNTSYCISRLCGTIMQIKFNELILELRKSKGLTIEALEYLTDSSNWEKTKEEIRTKFNVPKSVPENFI